MTPLEFNNFPAAERAAKTLSLFPEIEKYPNCYILKPHFMVQLFLVSYPMPSEYMKHGAVSWSYTKGELKIKYIFNNNCWWIADNLNKMWAPHPLKRH